MKPINVLFIAIMCTWILTIAGVMKVLDLEEEMDAAEIAIFELTKQVMED